MTEPTPQEYWKDFPEAPVSSTFKWTDADGYEHMTTFRAYSGGTILQVIDKFKSELAAIGGIPATYKKQAPEKTDAKLDWMRDGDGKPVIDKGKMILLVEGGADVLPEKFKIECPLHSGKNLFLNDGKYGRFLGHKMDAGGYCNANIYAEAPKAEEPF